MVLFKHIGHLKSVLEYLYTTTKNKIAFYCTIYFLRKIAFVYAYFCQLGIWSRVLKLLFCFWLHI